MGIKWKEIADAEDCEKCPLKKEEICPGGFVCYGGAPIEPPCCGFDDDTDLDEYVAEYFKELHRLEAAEDERIRNQKAKQERAKKSAETRRQMRFYCRKEIQELKSLEKQLESYKASLRLASNFAEAFNITNEMFGYSERLKQRPEVQKTIELLETKIKEAKQRYDAKRKEFYNNRKAGG